MFHHVQSQYYPLAIFQHFLLEVTKMTASLLCTQANLDFFFFLTLTFFCVSSVHEPLEEHISLLK